MSDRAAVAVAIAAIAGALVGHGPPIPVGLLLAAVAFATRRPVLLGVAAFALTGALAARSAAGLVPPPPGPFAGAVTVLSDPEPYGSGQRADVRVADGTHLQAVARTGGAVDVLEGAEAGNVLEVRGRVERPPPGASWLTVRHIAGILAVDEAQRRADGAPWMRAANALRDVLARGARVLPVRQRPLFLGFVLGDTRGQAADITDDFRGAGLSHLLAVSGQNLAFVLALAGPVLRRIGLRARLPSTLALIAFFALVTRFEPSVLRASVMAALAVTAATLGRPASSARVLALAVTALVVADPFLVRSVGFELSVGACAGIVTLGPRLARALPGPRAFAEALSVTVAAQAGVAPVLVAVFGGVPVASVPANLVAAPLAGPVMIWGLGAGVVAGLVPGPVATVLHWPTQAMIGWIAFVAHRAALLPLGELDIGHLVVLASALVLAIAAHHVEIRGVRRAGVTLAVLAVVTPALALRAAPPERVGLTPGATLWRSGATVLELDGRVDAGRLLEALRRAGVTSIDLAVARTSSTRVHEAVDAVRRRYAVAQLVTPEVVAPGTVLTVGRLRIEIERVSAQLVVDISDATDVATLGRPRGPPV